jgi:hypothetical protein
MYAMSLTVGQCSSRSWLSLIAALLAPQLVNSSAVGGDEPIVGSVEWAPNIPFNQKTEWDKTSYWAAIVVSPSTGKYAASCSWTSEVNASRQAREKCNSADARAVVLCCNGWCSLALGKREAGKDIAWGVGWGDDQQTAEKFALEGAHKRKVPDAKVVFSIFSRQMQLGGSIAYSAATGKWSYATGGARSNGYKALQNCKAEDAKVIAYQFDCWMALALGDDKSAYGWGFAGNRAEAESRALEYCSKRTKNAKVVVSFCTNGVEY